MVFGYVILSMAIALWESTGAPALDEAPENDFIEEKLLAADGARGDQLGWSVAIDGDRLAIGAVNAASVGAVYVFGRNEQGWEEETTLRPSGETTNASFGNSVDIDGDTLVVGSPRDQEGVVDVGAAYLFRYVDGLWQIEARLVASDGAAGDRFGESVSIGGDRLAIGAPNRDAGGDDVGAVYIFGLANGEWTEEAMLVAEGARAADLFGSAVTAGNGIVVAGAPTDTGILNAPGAAYVFEYEAGQWLQRARLAGPGSQRDLFGISVDVDARTIVVGAPRIAQGASGRPGGSAHVFEPAGSRWIEQARLEPSETSTGDRFGFAVSISGGTIVASAVQLCAAYAFRRTGAVWREDALATASDGCQAGFGRAVAVYRDTMVVGTPSDGERGNSAGAAYVYETSNEGSAPKSWWPVRKPSFTSRSQVMFQMSPGSASIRSSRPSSSSRRACPAASTVVSKTTSPTTLR
jgi:hypothetical protein